jgi:hypothetical protein
MTISHQKLINILSQTRVVRFARHRLATFGESEIPYHLVTSVSVTPPLSTLRTGLLTAARPQILTPDALLQRFQGFGPETEAFERMLQDQFQEAFRGLQYVFRHRLDSTVSHSLDARDLAKTIQKDFDARDMARGAVIQGSEDGWTFSLMKFIVEETHQSFASNMRELEERNLFDPSQAEKNRRRREVEALFRQAAQDSSVTPLLARTLKDYGFFDEFQDRFFSLMKK